MLSNRAITDHNEEVLSRLQLGDMIKYDRLIFFHYAIYVGDGDIVHLSGPANDTRNRMALVQRDTFLKVAGNLKAYKANRDDLRAPLPADQIVKNALSKVGEVGYDLVDYNCEHFANWCRYGKQISDQVDTVIGIAECFMALLREEAEKVQHTSQ